MYGMGDFKRFGACALTAMGLLVGGCTADDETYSESNGTDDVDLGEVVSEETARDPRTWQNALQCKPIPDVTALTRPEIIISLDGLTLHLRDRAGGYDRVFPIGPGALENGRSLTPTSDTAPNGVFYTGTNTTESADSRWSYYYPCRIWHDDRGVRTPVFAGLPFIRLAGPPTAGYGIHGPIDNFTAPNGGNLRRGFVSHGCTRMSADDIVEVFARVRGRARTPVKIQQAVERANDGSAIDIPQRWVGAECAASSDCNFTNGVCRIPAGQIRGTCTLPCTASCPDRVGEATTFCAPDPASTTMSAGICVPTASPTFNRTCDRYGARLTLGRGVQRPDRSARADVCRPAT
jgi:L,D-transpeptidase catalytic domain